MYYVISSWVYCLRVMFHSKGPRIVRMLKVIRQLAILKPYYSVRVLSYYYVISHIKLITNSNIAVYLWVLSGPFSSYKFSLAHSQPLFCPLLAYPITHAKEKTSSLPFIIAIICVLEGRKKENFLVIPSLA